MCLGCIPDMAQVLVLKDLEMLLSSSRESGGSRGTGPKDSSSDWKLRSPGVQRQRPLALGDLPTDVPRQGGSGGIRQGPPCDALRVPSGASRGVPGGSRVLLFRCRRVQPSLVILGCTGLQCFRGSLGALWGSLGGSPGPPGTARGPLDGRPRLEGSGEIRQGPSLVALGGLSGASRGGPGGSRVLHFRFRRVHLLSFPHPTPELHLLFELIGP